VQDPCARLGEARSDAPGIVAVHRLAVEVALLQPDDAAASQVDRRDHVERRCHPYSFMLSF
jgi:hypothetical protein